MLRAQTSLSALPHAIRKGRAETYFCLLLTELHPTEIRFSSQFFFILMTEIPQIPSSASENPTSQDPNTTYHAQHAVCTPALDKKRPPLRHRHRCPGASPPAAPTPPLKRREAHGQRSLVAWQARRANPSRRFVCDPPALPERRDASAQAGRLGRRPPRRRARDLLRSSSLRIRASPPHPHRIQASPRCICRIPSVSPRLLNLAASWRDLEGIPHHRTGRSAAAQAPRLPRFFQARLRRILQLHQARVPRIQAQFPRVHR